MNRRAFILGLFGFSEQLKAEELGAPGFWQNNRIRQCCSEADAIYADDWEYKGGNLYATVTGRGPRNHAWAPINRTYLIPPDKIVQSPHDPDGHAIMFLVPSSLELRCFVLNAGT